MMKTVLSIALIAALILTGCGGRTEEALLNIQPTEQEMLQMMKLTIGDHTIHAQLADNAAAKELAQLLKSGPIQMPASNYGGFEKVCSLGTRLTANDVQTTTQAGDVMLYSSNQIVIFYGTNSWAYTRLAKVVAEDIPQLQQILSGDEDTVTIELA